MREDAFSGKRVFVTGSTGFKGAWLCLWLQALGAEVTGYGLPPDTSPSLFEAADVARSGLHHMADLLDRQALEEALDACRPQVVLHLAAQSLVRRSYQDPVQTWRTNVLGTVHLLEACRGRPDLGAVVMVSSDKCYLPPAPPRPLTEEDRLGGHDPYSASKAAMEIAVASHAASFARELPPMASARAGNVLGGGDFSPDRLVPDCARAFAEGRPVRLRNPGHVRPWQHVLEPLAGYLLLCQALMDRPRDFAHHEGWNFAPHASSQVDVGEVAHTLAALWGDQAQVLVDRDESAPGETASLLLDNAKAVARLGWSPLLTLDDTLAWTAGWYKAFSQGRDARQLCLEQIERYRARLSGRKPATPGPDTEHDA